MREFFKNLPDETTPMTADRLNDLFNGNEAMGSIVVDDISCTDPTKYFGYTSGSNENGSWVKYDDGRMECRKTMTFSATSITTAIGSLFESASLTIGDFPVPFVGDYPDVFIMPRGLFFVERYPSDSLTSFGKFRACKPTSAAGTDVEVSVLAIGRWK